MIKRIQYDAVTTGFPPIVNPDSYQPNIDTPISNWQQAARVSVAAIVPFLFFVNTLGNATFPETVSADRTFPQYPSRIYDISRQQYTYPSLSWDTAIKGITVYSQQDSTVVFPKTTQYQSQAFVPLVGEVITVDKWAGNKPDKIWNLPRNQYLYPSEFRTEILEPISEPINSESYHPDKIYDLVKNQYLYPSVSFVQLPGETITVDKWFVPTGIPRFDLPRNQHTYPSFVIDTKQLTQPERVSVDKWIGNYPNQFLDIKHQQYTYPYLSWDTAIKGITVYSQQDSTIFFPKTILYQSQAFVPKETITLDKWIGQYPDKIFDLAKLQYLYPSEFRTEILTPVSEPINADSYHPDFIFALTRQQFTYPTFFAELTQVNLPTPDKWIGFQPDQFLDIKKLQYLYPTNFFNPELVPSEEFIGPDKWMGNYPHIIFDLKRQQYTYPFFIIDTKILTQKETITIDKWLGNKPDIIFDIKRQQYTYPSWTPIDPTQLLAKENITMEKWFRETEQPIAYKDLKRLQYMYPSWAPIDPFAMLQKGGYTSTPKLILVDGRLALLIIDAKTGLKYYTLIT